MFGDIAAEIVKHLNKIFTGDSQVGIDAASLQCSHFALVETAVRQQGEYDQPGLGARAIDGIGAQGMMGAAERPKGFTGLYGHHDTLLKQPNGYRKDSPRWREP